MRFRKLDVKTDPFHNAPAVSDRLLFRTLAASDNHRVFKTHLSCVRKNAVAGFKTTYGFGVFLSVNTVLYLQCIYMYLQPWLPSYMYFQI